MLEHTDEYERRGDGLVIGYKQNEHKPDCKRMQLIAETQAFLRAENELAVARGEEEIYVPE
jgi:hypothetical protein